MRFLLVQAFLNFNASALENNTFHAHVEAVGIVIEKSFQDGRALLEEAGYPVVSLARLDRFENGQVVFKEADI